ncbi:MAG: DNA adenine methyltransferase YhdJ [bacterium ADurb.Bin374]|nr:MAG: DNA adenine methyltransferase YhdJ [bacterium ADurb.Bin374]
MPSRIDLRLGDCLEIMKEIPDGSVNMVMCDLPYGTTQNSWDSVIPLASLWTEYRRICKKNAAIVLTAQTPFDKVLGCSNLSALKYEWIWRKESGSGHLNAKRAPMKNHENALVFCSGTPLYNPQMRKGFAPYVCKQGATKSQNYGSQTGAVTVSDGSRYPLSVLDFPRDKDKTHPTQKPVALMEYLIRTYTNEGETVLDNCMGSGTTGVACVRSGRNFIGIEKDETYFGKAKERIEEEQQRNTFYDNHDGK